MKNWKSSLSSHCSNSMKSILMPLAFYLMPSYLCQNQSHYCCKDSGHMCRLRCKTVIRLSIVLGKFHNPLLCNQYKCKSCKPFVSKSSPTSIPLSCCSSCLDSRVPPWTTHLEILVSKDQCNLTRFQQTKRHMICSRGLNQGTRELNCIQSSILKRVLRAKILNHHRSNLEENLWSCREGHQLQSQ